ncbi:MAG: helix-turn-helix transcriptional regulator [Eggerthellaceae bacterium]|nr:helix-turn-helix transcriptional regulator [Eggerthellaceae bacterium]
MRRFARRAVQRIRPDWLLERKRGAVNSQFKKGVLELVVLLAVRKRDMYGYELVEEISKVVAVNEGTVYPLLKRLTNERYFETYLRESTEGPPRKYYHITAAGILHSDQLMREWLEFSDSINAFVKEHGNEQG